MILVCENGDGAFYVHASKALTCCIVEQQDRYPEDEEKPHTWYEVLVQFGDPVCDLDEVRHYLLEAIIDDYHGTKRERKCWNLTHAQAREVVYEVLSFKGE